MARKRKELGSVVEARIVALMKQGGTVNGIAQATGIPPATIARRMRELAGKAAVPIAPAAPLPATPEEIPEGTPVEVLDEWLDTAKAGAEAARTAGNLSQLATMGRLAMTIMDQKRKSAPIPKADPNENPDMVKLGAEVSARLHKLVDIFADRSGK